MASKIDDLIREALEGEERGIISQTEELGYFALGLSQFRGKLGWVTWVIMVVQVVMFLAGDKLLLLFGDEYSQSATRLLWVLAVASFPMSVNHIYFTIKRVRMEMKGVVGLAALMTILALTLSYLLLPGMGIMAVGVGWLSAQGLVAVVAGRRIYVEFVKSIKSGPSAEPSEA